MIIGMTSKEVTNEEESTHQSSKRALNSSGYSMSKVYKYDSHAEK